MMKTKASVTVLFLPSDFFSEVVECKRLQVKAKKALFRGDFGKVPVARCDVSFEFFLS